MSMVDRINAVKEAHGNPASGCSLCTAIAAALAEAEKVDKAMRPTTNYCEVCAKRDAAFQRARGACRRLELCGAFGDINAVTEYFFGGGEGEG